VDWLARFDQDAFRFVHHDLSNPVFDVLMLILSYSGLGQVQAAFALLLLRWPKTRYYTLPLLTTIIVSGLVVAQTVKHLLERDRPSNLLFARPAEEFYFNSFPSGHSTTSFAVAIMLFLMTFRSRNAWIGKWAIVWAFLVGISRVYRGVHWPTDVMAGACAGLFSACLVYVVLRMLGRQLHLDRPGATISGQESAREPEKPTQ
jgi:undecaprenyl-diphosphatase